MAIAKRVQPRAVCRLLVRECSALSPRRTHYFAAMRYVGSPCIWHAGPLEDANVRAARQGIVDARGVGPSGRYRLRCVVESPWQPARVPAALYALGRSQSGRADAPDRDVLCDGDGAASLAEGAKSAALGRGELLGEGLRRLVPTPVKMLSAGSDNGPAISMTARLACAPSGSFASGRAGRGGAKVAVVGRLAALGGDGDERIGGAGGRPAAGAGETRGEAGHRDRASGGSAVRRGHR